MRKLGTEIQRFLVVGATTVAIDFTCYSVLLLANLAVPAAKATGFVAGMAFAWFANRIYTFSAQGGLPRLTGFVVLYLSTLGLNVVANELCLSLFGSSTLAVVAAFIIATHRDLSFRDCELHRHEVPRVRARHLSDALVARHTVL
jgi:putative flippase GtrA